MNVLHTVISCIVVFVACCIKFSEIDKRLKKLESKKE